MLKIQVRAMHPERSWAAGAIGRAIRAARKHVGMNHEELAFRAGLDRTYISALELGKRQPSVVVFVRLGRALGLEPGEWLTSIAREIPLLEEHRG